MAENGFTNSEWNDTMRGNMGLVQIVTAAGNLVSMHYCTALLDH